MKRGMGGGEVSHTRTHTRGQSADTRGLCDGGRTWSTTSSRSPCPPLITSTKVWMHAASREVIGAEENAIRHLPRPPAPSYLCLIQRPLHGRGRNGMPRAHTPPSACVHDFLHVGGGGRTRSRHALVALLEGVTGASRTGPLRCCSISSLTPTRRKPPSALLHCSCCRRYPLVHLKPSLME